MTTFGYALSSEEHRPAELVRYAGRAEELGYEFVAVSDHYHPWIDGQGESPFVWTVLGGIAQATERIRVGTGVTCPTVRIHPAIIAQAAATTAAMMPGRFFLGVGSGEALNEHILGDRWPPADVRLQMLEEAVAVIRLLWQGGEQSHQGRHYLVENARLYTLPDAPPPIVVAAGGTKAAELAGRAGDGFWNTSPEAGPIETFRQAGGDGKPRYGQITVCWAKDEQQARKTALELWPNAAISGQLSQDLSTPTHFEQAAQMADEDRIAQRVVCGPDPGKHLDMIRTYIEAGYDHVYFHQVGPDQEGFFRFYADEVLPKV